MTSRAQVEDTLKRIGELVQNLEKVKDPAARAASRQLFGAVLDLHGLALAKIAARMAVSDEGRGLYRDIGDDEQVRAVLLLHGLHPDTPEERIRAAVGPLEARLGVVLRLLSVSDGVARLTLDAGGQDFDLVCRDVGAALIDAAPDLDDIAIDRAAISAPSEARLAAG
jgi:hypothetical protein